MWKPDVSRHNPDPAYIRQLIADAGLDVQQAALILGISERMMRYYLSESSSHRCPYSVQYCLEVLAMLERTLSLQDQFNQSPDSGTDKIH